MTWAGESGPQGSGLYIFTDDGSPRILIGNADEVLLWGAGGVPEFVNQAALTGVVPFGVHTNGFRYRYRAALTDSDPGAGRLNLNNIDVGLSTEVYVDAEDSDGTVVTNMLSLAGSGSVIVMQALDNGNAWWAFDINQDPDQVGSVNSGYTRWPDISIRASGTQTTLGNNTDVSFGYIIIGNQVSPTQLNDLTDVNAPSPSTGDSLVWDGSEWFPSGVIGGGGGADDGPDKDPFSSGVFASGPITTTSTSDILIPGLTMTPPSGTYLCFCRGQGLPLNNNSIQAQNIYGNGVIASGSESILGSAGGPTGALIMPFASMGITSVDGTQDIEGRWRAGAGTTAALVDDRALFVIKIRDEH